ncbi:MAG TPA: ribosome small subunit-dependent GTPase A, partial [Anaerolineaceae bacterium]|nr:ribosome small subunit-dependent GTPase A [Anaerolineaceae bacterium]
MPDELTPGTVVRYQSGFYTVEIGDRRVLCQLRGRLKRGPARADLAAVGDRVEVQLLEDGTGRIESILPRRNELVRLAPTPRGEYRQVLVANLDQVVLVFSCSQPSPHLRMLDRFLVICEKQGLPAIIAINKVDLMDAERAAAMFSMYPPLGYPVLLLSAKTGFNVDQLHERLAGHITGLAGPSGVGKSSLLNAVQPELGLQVMEIGSYGDRGRHTTVVRELHALKDGGYVADLPGLRSLALWDTQPEELDGYFPELRDLVSACQFNDCTHQNEPGCAVRQAVEDGRVHPGRYESYLRLRA